MFGFGLKKARENSAMVLSQILSDFKLSCDELQGKKYVSSWEADGLLIKVCSDDVFNRNSPFYVVTATINVSS